MFLKKTFFKAALPLLLLALVATACGSTSTGSGPYGSSNPTTVPATTAPASGSAVVVKTASATVDGKSVTILTNAQGMTLYYRTTDTPTSVCSGGCAQAWPPLLFSGSGTPTSATPLPGTLSVIQDANGAQVAYQGHLLYTFASDTAPGQTSGQKVANIWFVATTDLSPASSGSSATPTPTSSGGYGY